MEIPSLQPFSLVGGTALTLRYGHRSSVDLELFSHQKFDHSLIEHELLKTFGSSFTFESGHTQTGIFCFIEETKVDIVHYPHLPISNIELFTGIRMYNDADIAAMKIQAILGRARKKYFWDIHELLQHHTLQQIIDWHKQKNPNQMLAISIPNALSYFVEAEDSESPVSFRGQTWDQVKKDISKAVRDYLR
ncbi:MAG: nucleotidyl transferase AbiEii/AbiGii toxin family protein [Bacteroidales bacterium]|nr:nucleotidyl transferase AbiEii/AbiGii toxin family protein [Bacteroidales bacterium]